jgi:hypothetical protein
MPKIDRIIRSPAEVRRDQARRTTEEALSIIDSERDAQRKKTAKLRKLRLAKENEGSAPAEPLKPKAKPKRASRKAS